MLIDWFTVCAQVINFLVLVWLMKRFLYKPILSAIEAREKKIAAEIASAHTQKAEAQTEHEEFEHKNQEFDLKRKALMTKATHDAKIERERLLGEARKAADDLATKRQAMLQSNAAHINKELTRRTSQQVFAISRKALSELASTSLEQRMSEVFSKRLHEMDPKTKEALGEGLKNAGSPSRVRSAFDLPDHERATIQNALNEIYSTSVELQFETSADVISGIELSANGQKVSWSIDEYLKSLESSVNDLLSAKAPPEPALTVTK